MSILSRVLFAVISCTSVFFAIPVENGSVLASHSSKPLSLFVASASIYTAPEPQVTPTKAIVAIVPQHLQNRGNRSSVAVYHPQPVRKPVQQSTNNQGGSQGSRTSHVVNNSSITQMILNTFGVYGQAALKIAQCESSLNPLARNPYSGTLGLFQFEPSTWNGTPYSSASPLDALTNIKAAYWLFVQSSYRWTAWSCKS